LTNVTVVAVDQRSSAEGATDKEGKLVTPRSVSLMVSPTDAQRIRLGARKGVLTLALRALADRESADPLIITGISDISQYQDDSVAPTTGAGGVLVIRGVKGTETKLAPAPAAAPVVPPAMPITPVPGAVAP
jgi:hypothetical protein